MVELEIKDEVDYYNKVEIEVKAQKNISGEDMKTIQDAANLIADTARKYYKVPKDKEAK